MSDPYLGEIRMFGGDYAPENWHFCDGTLLSISAYSTLYSLIGTAYGGDGISNFALPDLRGRLAIGQGQGTGLTNRAMGETNGTETVGLSLTQMPAHTHVVSAASGTGTQPSPENGVWAGLTGANQFITSTEVKTPSIFHDMNAAAIGTGYSTGGAAHLNMMPSFPLSFIIALTGEYPTRN